MLLVWLVWLLVLLVLLSLVLLLLVVVVVVVVVSCVLKRRRLLLLSPLFDELSMVTQKIKCRTRCGRWHLCTKGQVKLPTANGLWHLWHGTEKVSSKNEFSILGICVHGTTRKPRSANQGKMDADMLCLLDLWAPST